MKHHSLFIAMLALPLCSHAAPTLKPVDVFKLEKGIDTVSEEDAYTFVRMGLEALDSFCSLEQAKPLIKEIRSKKEALLRLLPVTLTTHIDTKDHSFSHEGVTPIRIKKNTQRKQRGVIASSLYACDYLFEGLNVLIERPYQGEELPEFKDYYYDLQEEIGGLGGDLGISLKHKILADNTLISNK